MSEGDVHVIPIDDQIEHIAKEHCVCGPTTDPVKREDGSCGWVIVHHSLDNREADENNKTQIDHATNAARWMVGRFS